MPIFNILNQANQDHKTNIKNTGRLLGLDLGTKRIGFAITDETQTFVSPKQILNRQNLQSDLIKIAKFIDEYQISTIILGYPIQLDNSNNDMTNISLEFANNLNDFLQDKLPILLFEERLTSFEAKNIARELRQKNQQKRKNKHIDDIAAAIILEHFLQEN